MYTSKKMWIFSTQLVWQRFVLTLEFVKDLDFIVSKWSQIQIFLVWKHAQAIILCSKYVFEGIFFNQSAELKKNRIEKNNVGISTVTLTIILITRCFFSQNIQFFFILSLFCLKSVRCDDANHGWRNHSWYDMYMCHWISIYTTIAIHFATHTIRIPGKDAAIVFGVYNCRVGRIYIAHRLSSLCLLWCSVSFYIFTVGLPIFCSNHRLCGWWIEFHYKDTWINGIWCAYTTVVLLHAMFTTDRNYQVCWIDSVFPLLSC